MMRLGGSADVGAAGHLVHFLKADIFQGALDLGEGNVLPELPHDGGCHLRHDIVALFNRPDQLKNLRLVRDGAERATHHTLTAAHAFVVVDLRAAELVRDDGLYPARLRAGPHLMRDCVVGTGCLTFAAADTFFPVDHRFSVHDGNRVLRTGRHARLSDAATALIAHLINVVLARVAGRRNHLHQRRLVILIGNIALIQPAGKVHGLIRGAQGHAHGKAHPLRRDRPFAVDAFAVLGHLGGRNGIGNRFDIVVNFLGGGLVSDLRHFFEYLVSEADDGSFQSSHKCLLLLHRIFEKIFSSAFNDFIFI